MAVIDNNFKIGDQIKIGDEILIINDLSDIRGNLIINNKYLISQWISPSYQILTSAYLLKNVIIYADGDVELN